MTTLNVEANSTTPLGLYSITVTGSISSKSNSTMFLLTVAVPELDGVGTPTTCTNYCMAQLLTTSRGGDVIILIAMCRNAYANCSNLASIIDGTGLKFVRRVSQNQTGNFQSSVSEYYAISSQPLKSDNITAVSSTQSSCCWQMQVFAIAGVNMATIFDTDPSVPAIMPCSGGGLQSCSASIATTGRDFVIAGISINDAGNCNPSPGFTEVAPMGGSGDVDYQVVGVRQGNLTFTCSGSDPTIIFLDAVSLAHVTAAFTASAVVVVRRAMNFTASASTSRPLWNSTPCRSSKV